MPFIAAEGQHARRAQNVELKENCGVVHGLLRAAGDRRVIHIDF